MSWLRGISLKLFIICMSFVLCSVTLVASLSYRFIRSEMEKNDVYYTHQLLNKTEQYLDLYVLLLLNHISTLGASADLKVGNLDQIRLQLQSIYEMNAGLISNIFLIRENLSIIGGNVLSRIFDEPREERRRLYDNASPLMPQVYGPYQSSTSGWTVTLTKAVFLGQERVVIALDMDLRAIEDRLFQIGQDDSINIGIISDTGQRVTGLPEIDSIKRTGDNRFELNGLSSADIAQANETIFPVRGSSGSTVYVVKKALSRLDWTIYTVLDKTRLHKSAEKLQHYFYTLIAIGAVLSLFVAYLITRFIRKPVYYLMNKMSQVKKGNLKVLVTSTRADEFGQLAQTFDDMLGQIRKLIADLDMSNEMKRKLEIQVLQSQINPHFLYNTLGSVSNVVELGRYEEVDPILAALIDILEYGISDVSDQVSLEDELENVRAYLYIQNVRYGGVFTLEEVADPELLDHPMLRMMLQPIVENSLFHGYCGGQFNGVIRIKAVQEEGALAVMVQDFGVGMTEEKARQILTPEYKSTSAPRRKRIGLYNIHERLRLNYGANYGLEIESAEGAGTRVKARVPFRGKLL